MMKYLKLIPGKGLSKNKPTCENAVSQTLYGNCTLRVMGSWPDTSLNEELLLTICEYIEQFCNHKVWDFAKAFRAGAKTF